MSQHWRAVSLAKLFTRGDAQFLMKLPNLHAHARLHALYAKPL